MRATQLEITYQQWMLDTSLSGLQRRSTRLRAVDDAIRTYDRQPSDENAFAIRTAFSMWKDERTRSGAAWPSERDRNGAVSALEAQLDSGSVDGAAYRDLYFNEDEKRADAVVMSARGDLKRIFENATVVFLGSAAVAGQERPTTGDYIIHPWQNIQSSLTDKASSQWDSVKDRLQHKLGISDQTAQHVQEWGGMFYAVADAAFGAELWSKVSSTELGTYVKDEIARLTASVPPWLGIVWDARSVGQEWAQVIRQSYHQYDIGHRRYAIDFGAPLTAYNAMRSCLKDEIIAASGDAALSSVSFFLKTLTTHLDTGAFTGPAIGLAEAAAKLAHQVCRLGFQYQAAKAMRDRLRDVSNLDLTVFKDFPLLGAYFLHCAELSSIIPLSFRFTPGWMNTVERLRRDADYVFVASQHLINVSPFKIVGIPKIKVTKPDGKSSEVLWSALEGNVDATLSATSSMVQTAVGQSS